MYIGRRTVLGLLALVPARSSSAMTNVGDEAFDARDWTFPGDGSFTRRALVLVPRGLPEGKRVPVLVLLHGLGETSSHELGVRAWVDRYGLLTSHARLAHPPVAAENGRGDLTAERARSIDDELRARPFDGRIVFVCPFVPNMSHKPEPARALEEFVSFVAHTLLPRVRAETPAEGSAARTGIDGCSLGGHVALELFLRKPEVFGVWGGVQAALREDSAPRWADRIADALRAVGPRRLHVETSRGDPFRAANVALARELAQRGIPHDVTVLPGPHDQPWLREVGTLEMLLWHDRALQGG
jgi:poly(3-hydroxybutyrate) depolymerase